MSQNIIFISEQLFKERTGASNQIDSKQLVPIIKVAQDMHIQPALGSTLYNRLQTGIDSNNLTATEINLLDNYITDALIWFTMSMLPMTMGFQLFSKGFLQKSAEESNAPSRSDLELIEQKYQSMAEFYKTRLIRFLQENKTAFNDYLYHEHKIDSIEPESDAYTCPIYIGPDTIKYKHYLNSPSGSGNGGGNNGGGNGGGGNGGCGDCPVTTDGVSITGDGTQANPLQTIALLNVATNQNYIEGDGTIEAPLTLSNSFIDVLGTGNYLPTPIVSIDRGNVYVHFMDEGFDWSSVQNPEIFLFRWKNVRFRKPNPQSNTTKRLAGWVHPNTYDNMTKYPAGCKFFRGNHYMHDEFGTGFQYNSAARTTEWSIQNILGHSPLPYERITIPMNRYMFLSESGGNLANKFTLDSYEVIIDPVNGWKYRLDDRINRFDSSKHFRITGYRKDGDQFRKSSYYCFALAVDNPLYTTTNNKCPKVFSKFSNAFAQIFRVAGGGPQGIIEEVKFGMNYWNRFHRTRSPHPNRI